AEVVQVGAERLVQDAQLVVGQLDRMHGASLLLRSRYETLTRLFPRATMVRLLKTFLSVAGALALGFMLAGCGSDTASSPGAPAQRAQPRSNPYTNPIKREGSSPPRLAGDGRYFGYVRAADAKSLPPTISV